MLKKYQLIYKICIFSFLFPRTFLGMHNNDNLRWLDLNEPLDVFEDLVDGLDPETKSISKNGSKDEGITNNLHEEQLFLVNSVKTEENHTSLDKKNKKRKLDSDSTVASDDQEYQIEGLKLKMNIVFKKQYFNKLFEDRNCIRDGYHSLPPQLITCMLSCAKIYTKKEDQDKKVREVIGILFKEDARGFLHEYTCANIITDRNDVIWHMGFHKVVIDTLTIFDPIKRLYRYLSTNEKYIFRGNRTYLAHLESQKDTLLAKNDLPNENTVTKSVEELSVLGGFPNKIISGNKFININSDDMNILCFPISVEPVVVFLTTQDR